MLIIIQIRIVAHKHIVGNHFFNNRVAAIFNMDCPAAVHGRADIAILFRHQASEANMSTAAIILAADCTLAISP